MQKKDACKQKQDAECEYDRRHPVLCKLMGCVAHEHDERRVGRADRHLDNGGRERRDGLLEHDLCEPVAGLDVRRPHA